jgi:hypothetical protein
MTDRDKMIEAMARAVCSSFGFEPDAISLAGEPMWLWWRKQSADNLDALLAALPGLGLWIGPDARNMTDDQAEAIASMASCCGGIAFDIYRVALAAAPNPLGRIEP